MQLNFYLIPLEVEALRALIASSVLCFVLVLNGFAIDNCCRDSCYDSGQMSELLDTLCSPSNCPECIVTVVYQERRYREIDEDCGNGTYWNYELYIDNIFFENCRDTCTNDSSACSPEVTFDNTYDKATFALHCLLKRHLWEANPPDTGFIPYLWVTLRTPGCFNNANFGIDSKQYIFCDGYHCCSWDYELAWLPNSNCYDILDREKNTVGRGVNPDTTCTRDCLDPNCSDFCHYLQFMPLDQFNSIDYKDKEEMPLKVFPNPSREEISIQVGNAIFDEIVIVDLLGKVILKEIIPDNKPRSDLFKISTKNYETGTYLITIKNKGDVIGTARFNVIR